MNPGPSLFIDLLSETGGGKVDSLNAVAVRDGAQVEVFRLRKEVVRLL